MTDLIARLREMEDAWLGNKAADRIIELAEKHVEMVEAIGEARSALETALALLPMKEDEGEEAKHVVISVETARLAINSLNQLSPQAHGKAVSELREKLGRRRRAAEGELQRVAETPMQKEMKQ